VPFRSAASYRGFGQILTKRFPTTFVGNLHETILPVHGSFAVLFSPLFSGQARNPEWSHKREQAMGWCQTEIYYPTETSYLKSVLLWLQEYWTGPAVQVRPLKSVPQGSRYYSPRRTYAATNRRSEIIDLPAFLPSRAAFQSAYEVGQRSAYYSVRRTHAALNRREVIVDQPAFLPPRNPSACRQRLNLNSTRAK
jgi:hypothetical protein